MNLEIIFEYLLNFTLALFIILVMYLYYNNEISSLLAWVNIIGGSFLRLILIELINQDGKWKVNVLLPFILYFFDVPLLT